MLRLSRRAICLGAVLASALGATAILGACGSTLDDEGFGAGGGPLSDGSAGDAQIGFGDAGRAITSALFVHASPSGAAGALGNVRVCWSKDGTTTSAPPFPSTGVMPESDYPGIPVGGGALLDDATDLAGADTLFAMNARLLEQLGLGDAPCSTLVCSASSCLDANVEYFSLPFTGSAMFTRGATNIVAIAGCLPVALDADASVARCGSTWTEALGNFHAEVIPLAGSNAVTPALLVQAAQLSASLTGSLGASGTASVSFGTEDASTTVIATLDSEGQVAPSAPEPLLLDAALSDYARLGFRLDFTGVDGGGASLFTTLADIQRLVAPEQSPDHYYGAGGTYVVAIVGDPNEPADGGSGTELHFLVMPGQPPLPPPP